MYLVSILRRGLLLGSAALLTCVASAQTYDSYGQPHAAAVAASPTHATYHAAVVRRPARRRRTTVVVWHRPFSHSLAIVGGSALGGAGVGALAGGPPGAIVGALAGGVGGIIYDRKTHKKRIVVRR